MKFTITYANSQNGGKDSTRAEVFRTARAVRNAIGLKARRTDVGCFNEIREDEDTVDVTKGMGRAYQRTNGATPNPIFLRRVKWIFLGAERAKFHEADGDIPTPARWRSAARVAARLARGIKIKIVCIHYINGAWNVEHMRTRAARQRLWIESDHALADYIDGYIKINPDDVVVLVGDFNRKRVGKYSMRWRWIHNQGILKMGIHTPPNVKMEVIEKVRVQIDDTDKPVLGATIKLKKVRS